jgi:hypothetical protein
MADAASKVYVGITSCVFTPTGKSPVTITDVGSIVKTESFDELKHHVDAHRWSTWEDGVNVVTGIVVNLKTVPDKFITTDFYKGVEGALVWQGKARNSTQKDRIYTASYARFLHAGDSSMSQAGEAGGSLLFSVRSIDGDTEPVSEADAS